MPKMITKIKGQANDIKTNIVNTVDITKALTSHATQYFDYELVALPAFDEKTGTPLVNVAHDTTKLAALLKHFIKK